MSLKASAYRNYSITVALFQPLVLNGGYIKTLDSELNSYSHTISAAGGFLSASISMNISPFEIDDWVSNGLGRHIVVYGTGGEIIWEGFVDNISINVGNDTIERGRLTEICNRCMVTYTPVTTDPTTGDEVSGTTTNSYAEDDEISKKKYGIWEQIVSGGSVKGVGDDIQEQILDIYDKVRYMRALYLAENKEPETNHNPIVGINSSGSITMTLDCKGYIEWLNYVYNFTPLTEADEQVEIADKIADIIIEDPNNIISRSISNLIFNGMIIAATEEQDRTARTIIDEAVAIGDINSLPWIFGIYENRIPYYNPISESIDYLYYVSTSVQKIVNVNNLEVMPWNVRPGKLLFLPDTVMGSLSDIVDPHTDPRVTLIEEVSFTAPDTLNISGKKVRRFEQYMASQGLV